MVHTMSVVVNLPCMWYCGVGKVVVPLHSKIEII